MEVSTVADIARVFAITRDDRWECNRLIFIKDNKIQAVESFTAKMTQCSPTSANRFDDEKQNELMDKMGLIIENTKSIILVI